MGVAMAALARLGARGSMDAGRDASHRIIVAGIAFHLGHLLGVRVFVNRIVAVGAGKTAVHAGLEAGALVVVAAEALFALGRASCRNIQSARERKSRRGTPFHGTSYLVAPPVEGAGEGFMPSSVKIFGFFSLTAKRSWQAAQSFEIERPSALV